MENSTLNVVIWCVVGFYAVFTATTGSIDMDKISDAAQGIKMVLAVLFLICFVVPHGLRQYGGKTMLVFFLISFVVSWCYESLSIATGFPFGNYYYSDQLGPKLGAVPLAIMPAYFTVCYQSWLLAHVLLNKTSTGLDRRTKFAIPFVASFIMVIWDMVMDPVTATVQGIWVWEEGGAYFGVPVSNFLGWFLCVYTIFQLLSVYLFVAKPEHINTAKGTKAPWYQAAGMYGCLALSAFVQAAFHKDSGPVYDGAGVEWDIDSIKESMGLVALVTEAFVVVVCVLKVWSRSEEEEEEEAGLPPAKSV
ncbi:protein of unknown function DUF422 [Kipferlia bialata]|uniref:Carotenoid biosynthesis protein n=1 Tax=Kipferlia bialata TaxID=797122 RepID=A0A391P0L6_9EUKA|nr:protein of unknown function DUF422 [Kipferlia bialata]|eukprot:g2094.t1